ncbi:hypothetical protein [Afifella marina]|uniref:Uncharacterized protein n=1 Tax=Afifella marina DSM 2698 TaxID=1120955 RepID=A0A1G5M929_AFIMA|nr:hypothetical protein [Afifella marina]MBK1622784.1 hypothetical protein [Afifella marina DSM 2698]MBK1625779.1 hypothetical protein [Afifella marina]MBK5917602.1 hypothetical protein [Afifella marina]RAI23530.1 hypothetical protein CH311_01220 [Afifella marina DSM 2698]SCZ21702.1 hypothetical protein SAMN03080610_00305 [Afifella marina DSM 2698]
MAKSAAETAKRLVPASIALAMGAMLLGGCPGRTYGTGEAPEMAIFSEVAAVGNLGGKEKKPIDYRPRSPLVMPPSAELRPPEPEAGVRTANWPTGPQPNASAVALNPADPDNNIARDDMSPEYVSSLKPLSGMARKRQPGEREDDAEIGVKYDLVRNRQAAKDVKEKMAEAKGIGITERRYLTDPPEAYREPAETAPVDPEATGEKKKGNFFTRMFK